MSDIVADYDPYLRLMCAAILRALEDHQANIKEHGLGAAVEMEPARFLRATRDGVFSMRWLCEQIEVDQLAIVQRMHERGLMAQLRAVVQTNSHHGIAERRARLERAMG